MCIAGKGNENVKNYWKRTLRTIAEFKSAFRLNMCHV